MKDFAEFLGWVTVAFYAVALLNFILKYVNKNYMNSLSKTKKKLVDNYRIIMRYVIKYHKLAGILAIIILLGHFFIMFSIRGLSITGLIALILMAVVVLLGVYGAYINKKYKSTWMYVHRTLSFVLIVAILIHVL